MFSNLDAIHSFHQFHLKSLVFKTTRPRHPLRAFCLSKYCQKFILALSCGICRNDFVLVFFFF